MPYFTNHTNGKIDAIYSGRFAFINPDNYNNMVNNFNYVTKNEPTSNGPIERTNSLKEELGHSIQFSKMAIGNSLNGLRWIVRQLYIYIPTEIMVVSYYKLRFLWFFINYPTLENMYKETKNKHNPKKEMSFSWQTLILKDISSGLFMLRHSPFLTALLFLSMPITIPIGYFLNRHFTVYIFAKDKGVIVEYGTTEYTRTLAEHKGFNRFMRLIVNLVQHGYMLNKRPWIVQHWVHIKLKTEKAMYINFPKLTAENPAFPDFETYINKIAAFAIKWGGCNKARKSGKLAAALIELTNSVEVNLCEIEKTDGTTDWNNVLGFFYMHGN